VRARYLQEQPRLEEAGASAVRCEESEVAAALAELLLLRRGAPQLRIREATRRIKRELRGEPAPTVDEPPPKAGPDDADAPLCT
ncbi:MAG: hypothetical protein MUC63_06465, partial [Planctomycetes bacterium]|nr:hypothetical protein [Planctomycetota bacterium]